MPRDRAERVALTEAAFRIANDRMARWEERQSTDGVAASYFCECGIEGCREEIRLSRTQYEEVRADTKHFAVLRGHIIEDLETEVERRDGYSIIAKPDALAPILDETDPRGEPGGPANDEASRLADEIRRDDG